MDACFGLCRYCKGRLSRGDHSECEFLCSQADVENAVDIDETDLEISSADRGCEANFAAAKGRAANALAKGNMHTTRDVTGVFGAACNQSGSGLAASRVHPTFFFTYRTQF